MLRAASYARVSGRAQAEKGYSLAEQETTCRNWCARQGYLLIEHVVDAAETGHFDDRPGMDRLRELVAARVVDLVVMVKLDRIGRTNLDIQQALHDIRALGVKVEFAEQPIGDGPTGRLMENMLGGFAEFEWELIRKRTMGGRAEKAQGGHYPAGYGRAGSPYGYRLIKVAEAEFSPEFAGRSGELLVVDAEAEVVQRLFQAVAGGASLYALARELNAEGLRTKLGHLWHPTSIRRIVLNPLYAGQATYGANECRMLRERHSSGRRKTARTARETPTAVFPVPALVSAALAARARQRVEAHPTSRGPNPGTWPLRGVLRCATCRDDRGRPYGVSGSWKHGGTQRPDYRLRLYLCNTRQAANRAYCGLRVRAEPLEAQVRAALDHYLEPGNLAEAARRKLTARRSDAGKAQAELTRLDRELCGIKEKLERLADGALAGAIPPDILAEKASALTAERERLQQRRRFLAAALEETDLHAAIARAEDLAAAVRALVADPAPERLMQAYRLLFVVYLSRDGAPQITPLVG